MSFTAHEVCEDMLTDATSINENAAEDSFFTTRRKKAVHFSPALDIFLLTEVVGCAIFASAHGEVLEKWKNVVNRLKERLHIDTTYGTLQRRVSHLIKSYQQNELQALNRHVK
jgi:hypothetical protein